MMRESGIDGDIGHIQDVNVGHSVDLHSHLECGCSQIDSSHLESLLSKVIVPLIILNAISKFGDSRKWGTKSKDILRG